MTSRDEGDVVFSGSVPDAYEKYLVPLIFQVYADDIADRVAELGPASVLELAAGTGVVTRAMSSRLPEVTSITATDLNQPMLDRAGQIGTDKTVSWRQADANTLPFGDDTFDTVVCQFGVMFFDRPKAYAEMRRVLRPRGVLVFNVWDRIENNEVPKAVSDAVATLFPDDPPRFLPRTPYGHYNTDRIRAELVSAGFDAAITVDSVDARSRAETCDAPAIGFCEGSPLRNEIEARGPGRLAEAIEVATTAIGEQFGKTDIDGRIRAHVVTARKL